MQKSACQNVQYWGFYSILKITWSGSRMSFFLSPHISVLLIFKHFLIELECWNFPSGLGPPFCMRLFRIFEIGKNQYEIFFQISTFYQPYRKVYIIINLNHDHNIPKSNGPKPFIEKFQILLLKFIWEKSFTKILPIRCIQKNNLLGKFSMKTIHKKRNFLEPHEKLLLV